MAMLARESLLTRAKLHGLVYDQLIDERRLRSLKTQLRQVLPALERPCLLASKKLQVYLLIDIWILRSC